MYRKENNMTVARIEEITVYTSSTEDAVGTHELNAWFDHSGITHRKLDFNDLAQIPTVLEALNTWWRPNESDPDWPNIPPATAFPLVVYTEVHSDRTVSFLPRRYIYGKDNIIAQLPTLYALGR